MRDHHHGLLAALALVGGCSAHGNASDPVASSADASGDTTVQLPGGEVGIGLDDLRFSARLGRIVSPSGRTGRVNLVDPASLAVTSIGGFTAFDRFDGSDQQGVESADEGAGFVFAVDRTNLTVSVVDPTTGTIVATTQLDATEPDYIRYVESTSEVWISNPGRSTISVLAIPKTGTPTPMQAAVIPIPGGVEGLTIDNTRSRAYTHDPSGNIVAVDLKTRSVVATWPTGCTSTHGIPAIDEKRGFLFAGCGSAETNVLALDQDGKRVGGYKLGSGATIMAYSPSLRHFYMRGDPGAPIAILAVSDAGALSLLGTLTTTNKGHCMAADDNANLWVCDWKDGKLLRFADPYPAGG